MGTFLERADNVGQAGLPIGAGDGVIVGQGAAIQPRIGRARGGGGIGAGGNILHRAIHARMGKDRAREIGPADIGRTAEMIGAADPAPRVKGARDADQRRGDIICRCRPVLKLINFQKS